MTPSKLITNLMKAGWPQAKIAEHIGVSQATVSRILSGKHKNPRYHVVDRLRRLVEEVESFSGNNTSSN